MASRIRADPDLADTVASWAWLFDDLTKHRRRHSRSMTDRGVTKARRQTRRRQLARDAAQKPA